jgi:hypothetical protein
VSLADQAQQAIDEAVTRVLNTTAGARPLAWELGSLAEALGVDWRISVTGQASRGGYSEAETREVLAEWATALGLERQKPVAYLPGVATFAGRVDDVLIVIWGVVDDYAWDAATAARDDADVDGVER